ncbi:unnamed protein product [Amoebophrya sp. A25]|nr:unnamed protein product [Amoebophrya sp. A25]|eukprot:GSA25T00014054001.1
MFKKTLLFYSIYHPETGISGTSQVKSKASVSTAVNVRRLVSQRLFSLTCCFKVNVNSYLTLLNGDCGCRRACIFEQMQRLDENSTHREDS